MVGFRHVSGSLHPVDPDLGAVQVGWCDGRAVRRDAGGGWCSAPEGRGRREAGGETAEAGRGAREAGGGMGRVERSAPSAQSRGRRMVLGWQTVAEELRWDAGPGTQDSGVRT